MEEKEKVTKPRGWNKESVGKDDQHKPKKENPKKKKSQNLEKNEKSGKNPKLPTADGSRQSRLDKENAEKEVANKNVWAERMSKQKKEDTDNDRVFVPGADDMKRTLGDTGMTLKASKPIREPTGPSYGRGDRSDQSGDSKSRDRKGARRDQVDRNNQSETKKDSRERYDRHDRNNRNNRDQPDTRRDDQKREKRKHKNEERYENDRNMDQSRGSNSRTAPSPAAGSNSAGPDQTGSNRNEADRAGPTVGQAPKKTLEFVAAEPPRTNIWAERIKQKTVEEQKTRTRDQPRDNHTDGPRDHHDNRTNQSERANKNDFFASKKEKDSGRKRSDRNRDQRKSRDTDHGSDVGGSKGNLAKFRENEKRKNEKRDFSGSNENVSRASKKRDQKKGGSNQRLNRLESKDEDEAPSKKPRRREDESKPKKKESGSSTEDVTGQRSSLMGRTSVRSKTGLSERAGKRRNERSKRQERFKNAYEFPKPADDIKDAQVPNVDAIRGGLSFRGLMRQRAGATCTLRGSRTDMRNRSSDQSTNQEDGIENENNQSEEVFNRKNDGEKKTEEDHKNLSNQKIDQKLNESLNVNAVEFNSSPSSQKATSQSNHFSPNSSTGSNLATSGGHFPEPEVTGISFIALPSPNQNNASLRSPAANPPTGIYGDTSSNSPQLVRVEDQSNSPIHIEESTLKKMERSRKAWDNAPISSGVGFNGFQPTPGQNAPANQKQASQGSINEVDTPTQQTSKDVQNSSFEVSPSQPICSEPVTANNWGNPNSTNQNTNSEWSKDAGGSGTISGANWGKSGQQSATDQWKKEQMPLQAQMNEVNQLQGIGPNPGLTNQINQMGAYSRQNQFPGTQAAGLGDMGALATNPLNAHLINSAAASYPGSNQQPSANQLSYPNFNNQNLFYNSQPQVAYNPNTLIQPNQLNNAFEFGGQQNLYSNQLGSSSFNSNIYGNDQRQSDFGFNNAYPGFDNTMLANLQRQTQSSNVLNFPQTSNGMNRYQNNITPGAFNLGMGAQQTQRPDMTAPNLRPNIGNPHHSSNLFGKSPSPSPASLTKLMGGNHFGSDFPFNQSANIPSFRLKTQTRSNSVTPPHHQRTSKRNDFNSFNMNGRGFDSSFESQKSYMSGNGNEFDPKMNQFMNRTNQNTNQQGSFDPVNAYFKQQGNSFGPFGAGGAGAGGGPFMNHGASGRNSRNGNNSNPNRGNNGNNVIGKFGGMDKNFGSGPVGSKLDQKGIIQDGRNIKGQKKNMNKDFLPSQKERNEGKQALISQVSELTNKFSSVGLEKGSSEPSPTTTPGGQQQQVAPPNGGGQSASSPTDQQQGHAADNIVLSVDDRKRLTLADTAPKGGGIRRIITQERS